MQPNPDKLFNQLNVLLHNDYIFFEVRDSQQKNVADNIENKEKSPEYGIVNDVGKNVELHKDISIPYHKDMKWEVDKEPVYGKEERKDFILPKQTRQDNT